MLEIEPSALAVLKRLQLNLNIPAAGLRLSASGDACQGIKVQAGWSGSQRPEDVPMAISGLVLLADAPAWALLQEAHISLGERQGESGLLIKVTPTSCQCAKGSCTPEDQQSQQMS